MTQVMSCQTPITYGKREKGRDAPIGERTQNGLVIDLVSPGPELRGQFSLSREGDWVAALGDLQSPNHSQDGRQPACHLRLEPGLSLFGCEEIHIGLFMSGHAKGVNMAKRCSSRNKLPWNMG